MYYNMTEIWIEPTVENFSYLSVELFLLRRWMYSERNPQDLNVQPIAFGVSFLHSQISIDGVILWVSFTTFRWKETKEIEIGDLDEMTLQMQ